MQPKGSAFSSVQSAIFLITALDDAFKIAHPVPIILPIGNQGHVSLYVLRQTQLNIMQTISLEHACLIALRLRKVLTEIQ